mmetsp:Transcript_8604/g.11227  ORF Transcript_8604/g.11227 Transcript_8604/m.11227 type:complete len:151 (-) Transcript_8604:269-721(-)
MKCEVRTMSKIVKSFIIAASIASVTLSTTATVQAHDFHKRHHHKHIVKKKNNDAVVWGIIGLAAGAIIANSANNHRKTRVYQQPVPQTRYPGANHYPPAPGKHYQTRSYVSYEPWSQGWYNYCSQKYRSFNPKKGTFRGYDGKDHFCVVK